MVRAQPRSKLVKLTQTLKLQILPTLTKVTGFKFLVHFDLQCSPENKCRTPICRKARFQILANIIFLRIGLARMLKGPAL